MPPATTPTRTYRGWVHRLNGVSGAGVEGLSRRRCGVHPARSPCAWRRGRAGPSHAQRARLRRGTAGARTNAEATTQTGRKQTHKRAPTNAGMAWDHVGYCESLIRIGGRSHGRPAGMVWHGVAWYGIAWHRAASHGMAPTKLQHSRRRRARASVNAAHGRESECAHCAQTGRCTALGFICFIRDSLFC